MAVWLIVLGVVLVFGAFLFAGFATWRGRVDSLGFFAIGLIGVIACITVAKLPDIIGLKLQGGESPGLNVQMREVQKAAQEVQTDADEVRQMKEQIEMLAKGVTQSKQSVSRMYGAMQQTWRGLFDSFAYIVGTANIHPMPDFLRIEILNHVNNIARFAYPDPQERENAIQRVEENIRKARQ